VKAEWRWRALREGGRTSQCIRSEVEAEFAFHLEERVAELEAAGLSPAAARAEALRRFGDLDAAREVCVEADLGEAARRQRCVRSAFAWRWARSPATSFGSSSATPSAWPHRACSSAARRRWC
jgi:hypothetical protein